MKFLTASVFSSLLFLLTGCVSAPKTVPEGIVARVPKPVSNNAVALVGDTAYSFAGLHAGKTWRDVTANATACNLRKATCRTLAPLSDGVGRLASNALALGGKVYIFGGYSVAEDGTEKSTPEVWVFDPKTETYTRAANIPVPVDDAVVLGFADRYAVLVSGWHDTDNIADVQVLDTKTNNWFNATAYPGAPVFGHAGAIHGNQILVCGGVKVVPSMAPDERRSFVLSKRCRAGIISDDAQVINWSKVGDTAPGAAYRRAALALPNGEILFYGGALNPYNYNGIGYNDVPSTPLARIDIARIDDKGQVHWRQVSAPPGMDFRGGVLWRGALITIGGMDGDQKVTDAVRAIPLPPR